MTKTSQCACRAAKMHRDCMYCGSSWAGEVVCGVCRLNGVDGRVIRGTEERTCAAHKATKEKGWSLE